MDNSQAPADNAEALSEEALDQEALSLSEEDSPEDDSEEGLIWVEAGRLLRQAVQEVQDLRQNMQDLRHDFDTKIKYDESKERQVDSLHRELQTYREGLHFKILRPIFIDLIAVHDDLDKLIENVPQAEQDAGSSQMRENLQSFQETIEEILRRNGVEPYCIEGDTYVPQKQRVLQVADTSDPEKEKKVARRVRKGFAYEDRVLRPELIVLHRVSQSLQ